MVNHQRAGGVKHGFVFPGCKESFQVSTVSTVITSANLLVPSASWVIHVEITATLRYCLEM